MGNRGRTTSIHTIFRGLVAIALALAGLSLARADAVDQGQELAAQAIKAAEAGDFAGAADLFRWALTLRPNHPGLTLRLARASARAGRVNEAFAALDDYAAMGLKADLANDDFAGLVEDRRFAGLQAKLAANATSIGRTTIAATLNEPQLIAEGLALDMADNRLYVGSVHKRKIVAIKSGRATTLTERNGLFGVFAIAWAGNMLWAASSALPQVTDLSPHEKGRAGLFAFDKTGREQRRIMLPPDGKEHVLGDLAVARNGDIYTSDSNGATIYRLRAGGEALEVFHASEELHSPQGLAFNDREDKLALADYSSGIHVIDVATGARRALAMPAHTTLHGIDAVVVHGRDLICVQNGIDPQRVIRVRLNEHWDEIEGVDVLAANLPEMSEPTLAVRDAGTGLLVIGDGQWSRFNDDGTLKADAPRTPTRIVRFALPPPRT